MKIFILYVLIIFTSGFAFAQHRSTLQLADAENSNPVTGAHVYDITDRVITTSNSEGRVTIALPEGSIRIRISHVSYKDTVILLNHRNLPSKIMLTPKLNRLTVFTVPGQPVNLIPDKPWFVSSYLHCNEGLLLLAFPQKRLNRQTLFLLDKEMEVITSTPWREKGELFRDVSGTIWIRGEKYTSRVNLLYDIITVGEEVLSTKEFDAGIAKIELKIGNNYYFPHFRFDNQWLDYYFYNNYEQKTRLLENISDHRGLILRETRHIFETNEFERRFAEMCFFAPVFAPIAGIENQVVLFNYVDDEIVFYDTTGKKTAGVMPEYHHRKDFKKIFVQDVMTGSCYAVFEDKGICSIGKIDLNTGRIIRDVKIPSFPFVEKISVHDGKLFFLYKEKSEYEYKKIYMMPVN